jgi:hypothetical protein
MQVDETQGDAQTVPPNDQPTASRKGWDYSYRRLKQKLRHPRRLFKSSNSIDYQKHKIVLDFLKRYHQEYPMTV